MFYDVLRGLAERDENSYSLIAATRYIRLMLRRLLSGFAAPDATPFEAFRAKALVLYLALVLLLALSWGVEHFQRGVYVPALVYTLVALSSLGLLIAQRRSQRSHRNARLAVVVALLAITSATYLTGGLRLTNVVPFIGLMVAAVFLLGREGVAWAVAVAVLALLFQIGHWLGVSYPDVVPPPARPTDAFLTWSSTAALVLLWLWAYERARTQTIEALGSSERRLRALFDGTPDLALLHDEQGRLLETNRALSERLGYSAQELAKMTLADIWLDFRQERVEERITELRERGQAVFEGALQARDGAAIAVEVHARAFELDGQPAVLSVLREIGERLAAERERAQLAAQLQQVQKMESVGRLAGGVAHDFNNLLTAISGYCELVAGTGELGAQGQRDLAEVQRAARRAASLTQQLLAFGRRQLITARVIDLDKVVEDGARMLRRLIGEDIELLVEPHGEPSWVLGDPHQLDQLLINLAVNARDAMPQGGELRLRIGRRDFGPEQKPGEPPPGRYVALEVSDTGSGMDEATRQRIFEPFFTTKDVGKGSGLGLATAYGVVKQNRGHITVQSEPGKGTTFQIYLPLRERPERAQESEPQETIPRGEERVVLVEDEDKVRDLAQRVLRACGYQVDACGDAEQARRLFGELPEGAEVDLLLTDVVMPGDSGHDLARGLRAAHPRLRVLFTSGYPEEIITQRGLPAAEVDLLLKPYTPLTLAQRVRAALDRPLGAG